MSRCRGCRDTVKRVKRAWRGNTVAMMHYRRIVKSRGRQKDREKDYAHLSLPHLRWHTAPVTIPPASRLRLKMRRQCCPLSTALHSMQPIILSISGLWQSGPPASIIHLFAKLTNVRRISSELASCRYKEGPVAIYQPDLLDVFTRGRTADGGSGGTGWAAYRCQSSSFASRPLGMSLG